ncbi:MAG: hypothetical protein E6H73_17090 [Betaproteobacteria bacterium]|nr:MAG: hypothetical protein E6H73_17090 [Betaproteobacteria bacterium]
MSQDRYAERIAPLGIPLALWLGVFRSWLLFLFASLSCTAQAGEHRFQLLLDTDNSVSTGCLVATARGPASGIEQLWTTVVTTSTSGATVSRIERQTCTGTTLGPSSVQTTAGWSAGLGNGSLGIAAIESFVPLSFLPTHGTMKVSVASTNATGGQDATASFLISLDPAVPPILQVPVPLSPWLVLPLGFLLFATAAWWHRRHPNQGSLLACLLLVLVSGLVWAATVTLDGNVGDWSGISPVAGNARGSAPIDANIVAVFYQSDAANLYFRIDADVRVDTTGNQPPVVFAGVDQTITLPAPAQLNGSAADDGLPNPPAAVTTTWSMVSGPGAVTFGNAQALVTTATFSQGGVYVLRLSADDGSLSASDDVQITVNTSGNQNPTARADSTQTFPAAPVQLNVLSNDSDPNGDTLTVISFSQGAHGGVACLANAECHLHWTGYGHLHRQRR